MVEKTDQGLAGTGAVSNVAGPDGGRRLEISFREVGPNHPLRVSTPVFADPDAPGYAIVGTPKVYPGQTVTLEGSAVECDRPSTIRLFARRFASDGKGVRATAAEIIYGEPVRLDPGAAFTLALPLPDRGFPFRDIGAEISGGPGARGRVLIDRVTYAGSPQIHLPDELPRSSNNLPLGWVVDADRVIGRFSQDPEPMTYFGKDEGRGVLVTGTDDWTDYTVSGTFVIAVAEAGGLIARYQGLQRFLALIKTRDALKLVLNFYGETVLDEMPSVWADRERHEVSLRMSGSEIVARVDGTDVLRGTDDRLGRGGAGYLVEKGLVGFRETRITGA